MVKLAKPSIHGTIRPRREMSLRFNALLSLDVEFRSQYPSKFANEVEVVRAWSEFGASMPGAVRVWAVWTGDSLAISSGLPVLAPSVASWTILI